MFKLSKKRNWLQDELQIQSDLFNPSISREIVDNFDKISNPQEDKHEIVVLDIPTLLGVATRQALHALSGLSEACLKVGDWWANKFWKN